MSAHLSVVIPWICTALGLLPLAWLSVRKVVGLDYWLIATALGISFLADIGALALPERITSFAYPLGQCGLIGVTLLAPRQGLIYGLLLMAMAVVSLRINPAEVPAFDVMFRTFAFGSITLIASQMPNLGGLRNALLLYFGLGLVAWLAWAFWHNPTDHSARINWALYLIDQTTRAVGIGWFCWAATHQTPKLVILLGGDRRAA